MAVEIFLLPTFYSFFFTAKVTGVEDRPSLTENNSDG